MAGLRKGKCYTKVIRAYTRKSKYKKWAFIKAIPPLKLVKFDQGDLQKKFESEVNLYSKQDIQLRHNALESARQVIHKHLADLLGNNYHLKVRPYPHHILREHKIEIFVAIILIIGLSIRQFIVLNWMRYRKKPPASLRD